VATREASIKVTVDSGAFRSGMRKLGQQAEAAAKTSEAAFKEAFKDAFGAGKKAAGDMVSSIKGTIGTIATLGGAVSGAALVKTAVDAEKAYVQLADQLSVATGATVDQAEAQGIVERAVAEAGGSMEEARLALNQLAGAGDLDLVEDALKRATKQAQRFGVPLDLVARATSRVLAKGIAESAEEAELLLENMNAFSRTVLGVDPDEAIDPNDISEFGAFVNTANSRVSDMTTLLSKAGDQVKDLGQAFEVVEELGLVLNTRQGLEKVRKEGGLARDEINLTKGSVENLLSILETGSPKAIKALEEALAGDRAPEALRQILGKDLTIDIAAGTASKESIKAVGESLRAELENAADNTATIARIQKTNAALVGTSSAKFQAALNNLEKAVADPKVVDSIGKLADKLPVLVESMTDMIAFVADKPLQAALLALSARILLAAAGTGATTLGKSVAGGIGAKVTAASAAGTAAKVGGGGVLLGKAGLATAAVGATAVLAAGAGGAAVGTVARKAVIDPAIEADFKSIGADTEAALGAAFTARLSGDEKRQRAALALIARQRESIKENESAITGFFGELAATLSDAKTPEELRRDQLLKLTAEEVKLETQLKRRKVAEDNLARSAGDLAGKLTAVNKGIPDSARGVDPPPAVTPGGSTGTPPV